ncbi:MAG: LysM peptidoglycan-binding domain-containing protein [Cryobacterium sp.]|nr:LysM peptidoglycan-binding domain-containing protein [Oligoflexia bacterium]
MKTRFSKNHQRVICVALFALSSAYRSSTVSAAIDPEKESTRISQGLKAYSDQDWIQIAGERSSEKYEIVKGDTLWGVSERLFGDAKVWPKIWEINNSEILNPHMIEPRWSLIFNSGSGLALPSVSLKSTGVTTVKSHYTVDKDDRAGSVWDEKTPMPGSEWKKLPRQKWENVQTNLPPNIDKDGFDTRNRVYLRKPATGLMLPHWVSCEKIEPHATVEGTRSLTRYVYRGSEITIKPGKTPLDTNAIYTMLDAIPTELTSDGRAALSYEIVGKVKILGLQNGTYIGEIISAQGPIERGSALVPEISRVEKIPPVAGATAVSGTVLADRRTSAFMSGQNKWVYIDRGTADGVDRGMIFRIFQNQDPKTGNPLTKGDVFVQGDVQIIQGCGRFSIGMFVWSRGEVPDRYSGQLMTDIADEKVRFYFNGEVSDIDLAEKPALTRPSGIVDLPPQTESASEANVGPGLNPDVLTPAPELPAPETDGDDWLDKLDNHQELKSEEENELKELETFKESGTGNQAAQSMETPNKSSAEALPSPPASEEGLPSLDTKANSAAAPANPVESMETLPPSAAAKTTPLRATPTNSTSQTTESVPAVNVPRAASATKSAKSPTRASGFVVPPVHSEAAKAAPAEAPLFDPASDPMIDPTAQNGFGDLPPPPSNEFPAEDPVAKTPAQVMKAAPMKSASGPKKSPALSPTAPFGEDPTEGLPPL